MDSNSVPQDHPLVIQTITNFGSNAAIILGFNHKQGPHANWKVNLFFIHASPEGIANRRFKPYYTV